MGFMSRPIFDSSNDLQTDIDTLSNTINSILDQYIDSVCMGDKDKIFDNSRYVIQYIGDRLPRLDYKNIDLISSMFDVYCRLCMQLKRNPTREMFYMFIGIYDSNVYDYVLGNRQDKNLQKAYEKLTIKFDSLAKGFLIDDLSSENKTAVNKIFIAKSRHGLYDTPIQQSISNTISSVSLDLIMQKLNAIEDKTH